MSGLSVYNYIPIFYLVKFSLSIVDAVKFVMCCLSLFIPSLSNFLSPLMLLSLSEERKGGLSGVLATSDNNRESLLFMSDDSSDQKICTSSFVILDHGLYHTSMM